MHAAWKIKGQQSFGGTTSPRALKPFSFRLQLARLHFLRQCEKRCPDAAIRRFPRVAASERLSRNPTDPKSV